MNVTLIAPILFDLGTYTIAPQLKAKGHDVKMLFIPELMPERFNPQTLSKKTIHNICELLKPSDLIGINGLSENYSKTVIFLNSIRNKIKKPVIWGGIHATLNPQDCIKYADIVCVGEGEEAIVELAAKMEANEKIDDIQNLIFDGDIEKINNTEFRSPVDLNSLLPFDYDLENQYVVEGSKIRNVEERDFRGCFLTYSSRGCPFRCSYCCNSTMLNKTYKEKRYCRQRDVDNVIIELKTIKKRFNSCKSIWFNEADFLHGKSESTIEEFSSKYRKEIGIPFYIWTNPAFIKEKNIQSLAKAGFKGTNIGTINANLEIQKNIYNRIATPDLYKQAAEILKENGVSVEYDFILCNPYENTGHLINNINLIRSLPVPFKTVIYSLTYFPETELFVRAHKDGIIKNDNQISSYTKAAYKSWFFRNNAVYLNGVASMMRGYARRVKNIGMNFYGVLPEPMLRVLISKPLVRLFSLKIVRISIYPIVGFSIMVIYSALVKIGFFYKRWLRSFILKDRLE